MRPSGRREKQRRNLPCRASPAECCQERRESLSRPCHNFSIGRHLWFGPMRLPPQQRVVQPQRECSSDRPTTFAFDFLQWIFFPQTLERAIRMPHGSVIEISSKSLKTGALTLGGKRPSVGAKL